MRMELLNVEFGLFLFASPDNGFTSIVDFEHEFFGLIFVITKDALEHESDVGHQVDGIIKNNDRPRLGGFSLRFATGAGAG